MSNLLEAVKKRRSIRKYLPDMVPDDLIRQVMEAGTYAACGRGQQSAVIIAVKNREIRDRISELNAKIMEHENFDPFYGAPVVLIVAADSKRATAVYDGSLVLGNMMLEASDLGLGSCWIHRALESMQSDLYHEIFKKAGLNADDYIGVGHLALGYADGDIPMPAPRRENRTFIIE